MRCTRQLAAVCCALLSALALLGLWLDARRGEPRSSPDFVICGIWQLEWGHQRRDCGGHLVTLRMRQFFNKVGWLSGHRRRNQRYPVILHIGANSFGQDADFYTELISAFKDIPFRLVAVEPDDNWNRSIEARQTKRLVHVRELVQIEIANVAVASRCPREVDFHRLSYQLALDYNISYDQWSDIGLGGAGLSLDNLWNSMRNNQLVQPALKPVHNMSAYLETTKVPCVTPAKLLEEVQVDPQDLVFVAVDAEQQDALIVEELLDAGVRPAVWVFESDRPFRCYSQWCEEFKGGESLVPKLRRRGYRIGKNCEGECVLDNQENIVAVIVQKRDEV